MPVLRHSERERKQVLDFQSAAFRCSPPRRFYNSQMRKFSVSTATYRHSERFVSTGESISFLRKDEPCPHPWCRSFCQLQISLWRFHRFLKKTLTLMICS